MALGGVDALAILLPTEAFLLAAVSVALAVDAPEKGYVSLVHIPKLAIPVSAMFITLAVAVGACTAWGQLYVGSDWLPAADIAIAVSLLAAVIGQALLTFFLALSMIEG